MRVQIKDLKPNPYRDMEHYPIDQDKIQSLKDSIEQTGFWDNILAREINGVIQIAYGHHRLEALKQVMKPTDYVDIPVKKLDDATMIQIMANENMEQWEMRPGVINETVKVARDFLNAELAKYESLEIFERSNSFIKPFIVLPESKQTRKTSWGKLKKPHDEGGGVGQTAIKKFLGKGWKQGKIQSALDTLDAKEIDQKAVEAFDNIYQGDEFKKAIRTLKNEGTTVPKKQQMKLVDKVKERLTENKGKNLGGGKISNPIQTIVRQEVEGLDELEANIKDLQLEVEALTKAAEKLSDKVGVLNGKLHAMGVTELKSLSTMFTIGSFAVLFTNVSVLAKYFGFDFNNIKEE